jgi:hypothetical protein
MALALAKIAGLPVAEFLGGMLGQAADAGTVSCPNDHENFPSAKFCAECGASMTKVTSASVEPEEKPARQPRQPRVVTPPPSKSVQRRVGV